MKPSRVSLVTALVSGLTCLSGPISTASATVDGVQLFAWSAQARYEIGETVVLANEWSMPVGTISVKQTDTGRYTVSFAGGHVETLPLQVQVGAYGAGNVRCNFYAPPTPRGVGNPFANQPYMIYTDAFVACHTPRGAPADSKFLISFSATPACPPPLLDGEGAFFRTEGNGARLSRSWRMNNLARWYLAEDTTSYHSSNGKKPRVARRQQGVYDIVLYGLGRSSPGVVQVTAISDFAAHCKATRPVASGGNNLDLSFQVSCFEGSHVIDSDFMLNYDRHATRISEAHQGARAYVNDAATLQSYTPLRSWNTGSDLDDPQAGVNIAGRYGTGWYFLRHTKLSAKWSSIYVASSGIGTTYCKVLTWYAYGDGVQVETVCFDANGNPVNDAYIETYQGPQRPD